MASGLNIRKNPTGSSMDAPIRTIQKTATDDTSHVELLDDLIGLRITELLNAGAFASKPTSMSIQSLEESFSEHHHNNNHHQQHHHQHHHQIEKDSNNENQMTTIFPIFSMTNITHVKETLHKFYQVLFNIERTEENDIIHKHDCMLKKIHLPNLSQAFHTTLGLLVVSSLFISICSNIILSTLLVYYVIGILLILSILFDYRDLDRFCPLFLQRMLMQLMQSWNRFGIRYLCRKRFEGRDQWYRQVGSVLVVDKQQTMIKKTIGMEENEESSTTEMMERTNTYQSLMNRSVPVVISNNRLPLDKTTNITKKKKTYNEVESSSAASAVHPNGPAWQCQNVDWDKMQSSFQKDHNDKQPLNNNKQTTTPLHQSTLDHLIATNYCFVMIHGHGKTKKTSNTSNCNTNKNFNSQKVGKLKLKKKMHRRRQEQQIGEVSNNDLNQNNHNTFNSTPLSPIFSTKSEDFCDERNKQNIVQSVQSMDAIEVIRPQSSQRDVMSGPMKVSPLISNRSKNMIHGRGSKSSPHLNGHLQIEYDQSIQTLLEDDLTLGQSEDYLGDDDLDSLLTNDEDVSYSSRSYDDNNNSSKSVETFDIIEKKEKEDVKWIDVGAKIGRRILESEKLHQVITKSQMKSNEFSSFSADDDYDTECKQKESSKFDLNESPKNVAKPFHAMWTSPNIDVSSFDIDDATSEDDFSTSDKGISGGEQFLMPKAMKRASTSSLSPTIHGRKRLTKPMLGYRNSISLPCSPIKSRNVASGLSEANTSISSLETSQTIPKSFDANRYLLPSMAIQYSEPSKYTSPIIKNDIKQVLPQLNMGSNVVSELKKKLYKESMRQMSRRRSPLLSGVRMIVPIFPSSQRKKTPHHFSHHQFATVISSQRINSSCTDPNKTYIAGECDCLSITVLLDKYFLRCGKFAQMTIRISDKQRNMPRHSKFPIGACIATTFGIGVLVGWRAEDDCHIVRSLWQKRGQGAAHAYLNRSALHEIMEAAVGFKVGTLFGKGHVLAYTQGGKLFTEGKYSVLVKTSEGRTNRTLMEVRRSEIQTCHSSKFIPVVEQIKEAAKYQIQIHTYESIKLQRLLEDESVLINQTWRVFSEGFELFLSSFIKAAEEDDNIDSEINNFLASAISFLEDFDLGEGKKRGITISPEKLKRSISESTRFNLKGPGMWIVDDLLGDVTTSEKGNSATQDIDTKQFGSETYKKVYAFLNTAARTVAIAQSSCTDRPNLKMALAITHEVLIFIHNVIKVQQVNMSKASVEAWHKTLIEFTQVFGPVNVRLQAVGNGIIQRIQEHGKIAKVRAIYFADTLISDDLLMKAIEIGDIKKCLQRVENAVVSANLMDSDSCAQIVKIGLTLYNTLAPRDERNQEAARRSGRKITLLAKVLKVLATPGRSILKLFMNDDVLEIFERVLVRVFEKENDALQVINVYSWNFRSLRHLRILNNMAISGVLWAPVLDAADEEFTWAVSRTPESTRDYVVPISKLFSLGVARFHQMYQSDEHISNDWLDFLKEDEAIQIIQDLDAALMLSLENLCKDVKDMMQVLPYYSSIDEDFLRLIDEVDLQQELKEAGDAILDPDRFPQYVREKSIKAVSKFLDYLPKMSIPIERRDIGEGWVVTCRGRNGKDLTLSHVNIEKENLLCQVLGGDNVLLLDDCKVEDNTVISSFISESKLSSDENGNVEVSILDHVAELIRNAQSHDCWDVGTMKSDSPYVSGSSLEGLPLSEVLLCAIDLWENLEIDDDELLEIAIRDVAHQIQKQKELENKDEGIGLEADKSWLQESKEIRTRHKKFTHRDSAKIDVDILHSFSSEANERRFDPKKDSTVLYLALSQLTCCLDDFTYRLEPSKRSMFDPVFEGIGTLSIENASIKLRIECRKERIKKLNEEVTVPVLQIQELHVGLEQVNFGFKETVADWLLNKIISNFSKGITQLVRENLQEQISRSIHEVLDHLNRYMEVNPDIMLKILGITIDDLEENVAWV